MTTKVTIDAHAGWPVEVTFVDQGYDSNGPTGQFTETKQIVPARTAVDFHISDSRELRIKELKADEPQAA